MSAADISMLPSAGIVTTGLGLRPPTMTLDLSLCREVLVNVTI